MQRKALKAVKPEDAAALDGESLTRDIEARLGAPFAEEPFARAVLAG